MTSATHSATVTADAIEVAKVIMAAPLEASDTAPFDAGADANTNYGIEATNTRAKGVGVTVTDPGPTTVVLTDDEALDKSTPAPYLSSKWSGSRHERTDQDGVKEVVTVYSNIEPAGDEPYLEYYDDRF